MTTPARLDKLTKANIMAPEITVHGKMMLNGPIRLANIFGNILPRTDPVVKIDSR